MPSAWLTKRYDGVSDVTDLPEITRQQIEHFFANYKALEPGKWVKIIRWGGADEAREMVLKGIERAKAQAKVSARPCALVLADMLRLRSIGACPP